MVLARRKLASANGGQVANLTRLAGCQPAESAKLAEILLLPSLAREKLLIIAIPIAPKTFSRIVLSL